MDREGAIAFLGMCAAVVLGLKIVVDGVTRILATRRAAQDPLRLESMERRLEHLTVSVEAIALEIERQGELQRFSAQLVDARLRERTALPPRDPAPATPHSAPHNTPHNTPH